MSKINKIQVGSTTYDIEDTSKVGNTDYATSSVAGVIKPSTDMATDVSTSSGKLRSAVIAYVDYPNYDNRAFISKGTLNNVLDNKIGNINTILATLTTPSNNS